METIANAVSKAKDLDIRFYYYEPLPDNTVRVVKKSPKEIYGEEVPGITVITDILASWALSLRWSDVQAEEDAQTRRDI